MTLLILGVAAAYLYCLFHVFIHETAHMFVMRLFGVWVVAVETGGNNIGFTLGGVRFGFGPNPSMGIARTADGCGLSRCSNLQCAAIYLAGPIVDFGLIPWAIAGVILCSPTMALGFVPCVLFWWVGAVSGSLSPRGDLHNFVRCLTTNFA
jgi:hypothetical protein